MGSIVSRYKIGIYRSNSSDQKPIAVKLSSARQVLVSLKTALHRLNPDDLTRNCLPTRLGRKEIF
jgi:hypothetical protein